MKYTAITDGGKYGVQPTMSKPSKTGKTILDGMDYLEWHNHLLTLPRYLRTQGLELLPDGEEFEARKIYQRYNGHWTNDEWGNCSQLEYESTHPEHRRQVLAPLVKDETEHLLSGNNGERLKESQKQLIIEIMEEDQKDGLYEAPEDEHAPLVKDQDGFELCGECKAEIVCRSYGACMKTGLVDKQNPEPVEQEGEIPAGNRIFAIYKTMPESPLKRFLSQWFSPYDPDESPKQSDAVEFAEWVDENYFRFGNSNLWSLDPSDEKPRLTTHELYKLFTLK